MVTAVVAEVLYGLKWSFYLILFQQFCVYRGNFAHDGVVYFQLWSLLLPLGTIVWNEMENVHYNYMSGYVCSLFEHLAFNNRIASCW